MEVIKNKMVEAAHAFLDLANALNEKVSAYIDGSDDKEAMEAYFAVKNAEANFLEYYNKLYDDNVEPALNYEIAESVL